MSNYYRARNFELHPMNYVTGMVTSNKINVSAGSADFIETATTGNDVSHEQVMRRANQDSKFLEQLGMSTLHLITFYAFARKNGYEYTKLVGMADDNTYEMFQNHRIVVTPDNLWFNNRKHAILVAAALSQLYANT